MSDPIRVLHATGVPEGGVIALLLSLHEAINRDAIQFDIIMPDSAPFASAATKLEALGGRAYKSPALKYRNLIKLNAYFDSFFREHSEYSIVHTHGVNNAVVCLRNAKKHGVPHRISHSHGTKYADYPLRAIRNKLLLTGLGRYATGYMACSNAAGEFLFGEKHFVLVRNAISVEKFAYDADAREKLRQELGLGSEFVVGNIGLFRRQKNHCFMIRILKSYLDIYGEGRLLLVGDGKLRSDVERMSEELDVREHVVFAGMRADVSELLSAMDVFLMTSFHEGLPITIVEAQTSGLPCIYSDAITPEVRLTSLAHQLKLSDSAETWADAINAARTTPRRSHIEEITAVGYDIRKSAEELASYYQLITTNAKT